MRDFDQASIFGADPIIRDRKGTRRTEWYMFGLAMAALAVYLALQLTGSIRVGNYGAAVALDSFMTGTDRPSKVSAWAACRDVGGWESGSRVFPIAPSLVGTPAALVRGNPVDDDCSAADNFRRAVEQTRFSSDRGLAVLAAAAFPLMAGLALLKRRKAFLLASVLCSLLPFAYDAASSSVWTDPAFQFPGQHAYVASNVARLGIYGWNAEEMIRYGFPSAATAQWGIGEEPKASGWTYPGYTLLLAGAYFVASFFHSLDASTLVVVACVLNVALVLFALMFLGRACAEITRSSLVGAVGVYLGSLSGWAWSLCPFPASEPLQALLATTSLMLTVHAMRRPGMRIPTLLALSCLAGLGHVTKPVLGAIPSAVLLVFLAVSVKGELRRSIRLHHVLLVSAFIALPSLLIGLRNLFVFGHFVTGSTVGNVFLAQSLDVGMKLPDYFGAGELEYGASAKGDVANRLAQFFSDPIYRTDLLLQKTSLLMPTVIGLNWVAEVGRMGNDGYSGTGLLLVPFCAAWALYLFCTTKSLIKVDFAVIAIIFGFIAVIFLSQPLGRYFSPAAILSPFSATLAAQSLASARVLESLKVVIISIIVLLGILLVCWHDGWFG